MEISRGRFETLSHTVYDGERMAVPLLVDRKTGLNEDSKALLHAADILGANLLRHDIDIGTMFERIAQRLSDEGGNGVIVEDPDGKGSLNITSQITSVSVREVGTWELPTTLLFDMAQAWAELSDKDF
ncbi:MAG TPA: hypothetical protein VH234_00080 [Candidatus Saccharimonadales bacterium]|jgi:hypothetical protein|nr:hypothetical protein [Candidatus Saccharimonadales bacterium]